MIEEIGVEALVHIPPDHLDALYSNVSFHILPTRTAGLAAHAAGHLLLHKEFEPWTDGSHNAELRKGSGGFAITGPTLFTPVTETILFQPCGSSYEAEAVALREGLVSLSTLLAHTTGRSIAVYSDSLSCLAHLHSLPLRPRPTLQSFADLIQMAHTLVTERGHTVSFVWVPGHEHIGLNDLADELAGEDSGRVLDDHRTFIRTQVSETRKVCLAFQKRYYEANLTPSSSLQNPPRDARFVQLYTQAPPTPDENGVIPWQESYDSRVFRVRSGHNRTHSHLHRIGVTDTSHCRYCSDVDEEETSLHVLAKCPAFASSLGTLRQSLPSPLFTLEWHDFVLSPDKEPHLLLTDLIDAAVRAGAVL